MHCAIYSYIVPYGRDFSFCHVFRNVRYWSNSKITSISYNYNTKYTTKCKHALALYDVAINSTMHICILMKKI